MTRAEHLQQAKDRALVWADRGDIANAISSLHVDLDEHPETRGHSAVDMMWMMAVTGQFDQPGKLRQVIEGVS